jgi:hypothetical protein
MKSNESISRNDLSITETDEQKRLVDLFSLLMQIDKRVNGNKYYGKQDK